MASHGDLARLERPQLPLTPRPKPAPYSHAASGLASSAPSGCPAPSAAGKPRQEPQDDGVSPVGDVQQEEVRGQPREPRQPRTAAKQWTALTTRPRLGTGALADDFPCVEITSHMGLKAIAT